MIFLDWTHYSTLSLERQLNITYSVNETAVSSTLCAGIKGSCICVCALCNIDVKKNKTKKKTGLNMRETKPWH